jgi:hypothetical protein
MLLKSLYVILKLLYIKILFITYTMFRIKINNKYYGL